MSTKDWGPPAWHFLHHVAISFSTDPTPMEQKQVLNFLYSLESILPCARCKMNWHKMLIQYPPDVSNSCALQRWMFMVHNIKNQELGKPLFTEEEYAKKYAAAIRQHQINKELGL